MNRMLYGVLVASSLLYSAEEPKKGSSKKIIVLTLNKKNEGKKVLAVKTLLTRKNIDEAIAKEKEEKHAVSKESSKETLCFKTKERIMDEHSPVFKKEENIKDPSSSDK